MTLDEKLKLSEIEAERSKYKTERSFAELRELQVNYDRSIGAAPLTLDEINQYIKEVREGATD